MTVPKNSKFTAMYEKGLQYTVHIRLRVQTCTVLCLISQTPTSFLRNYDSLKEFLLYNKVSEANLNAYNTFFF